MAAVTAPGSFANAQSSSKGTVFRSTDEEGRTRTKIIIEKRSYLDGGTEVMPGDRKYLDYVQAPNQSPTQPLDNTVFNIDKQTRPGPFDLPGKNNPLQ